MKGLLLEDQKDIRVLVINDFLISIFFSMVTLHRLRIQLAELAGNQDRFGDGGRI